jgi:hypothetical protein
MVDLAKAARSPRPPLFVPLVIALAMIISFCWALANHDEQKLTLATPDDLKTTSVTAHQPATVINGVVSQMPIGDTLAVNGGLSNANTIFDIRQYGALCNGVADDSSSINQAIIAAANAGGGIVQFPSATCVANSQITIPVTLQGGPDPCIQNQIRLRGTQAWNSYAGVFTPNGGTILVLGSNPVTCGQICTLGTGMLEVDHIMFEVTNTAITAPMFYQTLTRTHIHDNAFYGASGMVQQIAIMMGGTNTGAANCTASDPSGGYGTVIDNNFFNYVQQALVTRAFAAGYWFTHNTIWANSAYSTGAPIEIDGPQGTGATIESNRIEMPGYAYAIDFGAASGNSVIGNTAAFNDIEDTGPHNIANYHFSSLGCNNTVIAVNGLATQMVDNCGTNTVLSSGLSTLPNGITVGTALTDTGTSAFQSNNSNVFGTSSASSTTPLMVQNTMAGSGTQIELSSNAGGGSADIREDGANSLHIEAPTGSLTETVEAGSSFVLVAGAQDVIQAGSASTMIFNTSSNPLLDVENTSSTVFMSVGTSTTTVAGAGAAVLAASCTTIGGDCYESITDHAGAVTYLVQRNSGSGQVQAGNGPLFLTAAAGSNVVLQPAGATALTVTANAQNIANSGGTQVAVISTKTPSASAGTLSTNATDYRGQISAINAHTTVLTFGDTGFSDTSCSVIFGDGTLGVGVSVTNSATAPTFSCFTTSTGAAVNCTTLDYICIGR